MPTSVAVGLLLSVATAVVAILGFLFKQRGAVEAPPVDWRKPVSSVVALFRNRWWALGIAVAMGGWVLHVAALALAPISLVQATIAGGLVLLTPIADKLFGHRVGRREWIGVGLTALGLAFLAATLGDTASSDHGEYDEGTLVLYVGALTAASLLCMLGALRGAHAAGIALAVAAGLQWGGSDVTIKAASGRLGEDWGVFVGPEALTITVLSLIGLIVSARSLQLGKAVAVIAVTSAAANLSTIAAGPIVFGEPMPDDPLGVAVRLLAFALVIGAAAFVPGPEVPPAEPAPRREPALDAA